MKNLLKPGTVVRFKNPLPHEDQNMLFLIKEAHYDIEEPRGLVQEFDLETKLASTFTIILNELEPVFFNTENLIGTVQIILTEGKEKIQGSIIEISKKHVNLNLQKTDEGVITNVPLTIITENNQKRSGNLFLTKEFCQEIFDGRKVN